MRDGMFVFDAHSHVYGPMRTIWGVIGQTADDWIRRMDSNGIDMAMIMGTYQLAVQDQRLVTDTTIAAVEKYPDRFIGFVWASPMWEEAALDEMRRAADGGLRGLKLYPHGQGGYPIDSPLVDPLVDLAEELDWVTMVHTDIDSKVCSPHLAIRLAKRHPNVPVIFAHMGLNPDVTHFIPDYVKDTPNIYLDTSASPNLPQFVYKTPMAVIPDRMLFGSDAPTLSPEVELKKVEVAEDLFGLTKEEKRKVLGGNAVRLFKIDLSKYVGGAAS
jgi:predicted TIM-barrel fold metal-dependent hydrolase